MSGWVNKINRFTMFSALRGCSLFLIIASSLFGQPAEPDRGRAMLKTTFIYKFTNYVYWPKEDLMKEFRICVMSSPELAEQLNELPRVVKFRNRLPIKIVYCQTVNDIKDCEMLIVNGADNRDLWSVYAKIRNKPVLMIAEDLLDYKKSMISFKEVNGKMKFIINKTKLDESGLAVNQKLYDIAIVKEGEWKSLFEKFQDLLKSGEREVKIEKNELSQMLNMYTTMEREKLSKEVLLMQLEDTMREKIRVFNQKMEEYKLLSEKIEEHKLILAEQQEKIGSQKSQILTQGSEITRQRNVIIIIAVLSAIGIVLLLFTINSNNQRRKANKILAQQKSEIEKQKHLVDEKQKEILDSINYARRIQTALMAGRKILNDHLPDHFVLFIPKDIVAGDFYWVAPLEDSVIYVTADCTGHGVPGAFMSLLNISKLNEGINQKNIRRPDQVLNYVRSEIISSLNPEGSTEESKDGMDAILCRLDTRNMILQYAAANNSFCIIRNGVSLNCKADKMPVGKSHEHPVDFTFNEVGLQKGDMIYTYTDGFSDQFGGPRGKKYKHRQLKNILIEVAKLPVKEQKEKLLKSFRSWKGDLEQVDDVLIIGVRV